MSTPVPSSRVQYVNPDRTPTRALYYFLEGITSDIANVATVTNVSAIVSTVSALQTTVTNLTTTVTNLATTVTALQTTVTNLTTTVNNIGTELDATLTSGAALTVTSGGTVTDILSISLPVGKWLCYGNVVFHPTTGTTAATNISAWIGTAALTNPANPAFGSKVVLSTTFGAGNNQVVPVGTQRIVSDGTVTAFLGVASTFAGGASPGMQAYGYLQAVLVHS